MIDEFMYVVLYNFQNYSYLDTRIQVFVRFIELFAICFLFEVIAWLYAIKTKNGKIRSWSRTLALATIIVIVMAYIVMKVYGSYLIMHEGINF